MLVVTSTAFLKMRTLWDAAFFGRGRDFQQVGPKQFFLLRFRGSAHFLARKDIRDKNRVTVGVREAVAAVNQLLNGQSQVIGHGIHSTTFEFGRMDRGWGGPRDFFVRM